MGQHSYMATVNIALLKNTLSKHLAAVRKGGEVVVVDRNTPVARIVPYHPGPGGTGKTAKDRPVDVRLTALVRQGAITPGTSAGVARWVETHRPVRLPKDAPSLIDIVVSERRESVR